MKNKLFLMVLLATLAGCTKYVNVPVVVPCPKPPAVSMPYLEVEGITNKATREQKQKAVMSSFAQCVGYATELEIILNGYR